VCGVVVEEASREVEVTGLNHDNPVASRLYAKKLRDLPVGGWPVGSLLYKKVFFLFIFGFYVLTRKTSVLAGGGRTTASTETICAGTRSLAGAPPASKDPFYLPAQIVCGLVTGTKVFLV
jgi:hypothetical protein